MQPVVTVAEMAALDAEALQSTTHAELVDRAGAAVAEAAIRLLGDPRDRNVVVIAGGGSNGADGRVASQILAERGAVLDIVSPTAGPGELTGADLVIDAAFGTGLSRDVAGPSAPAGAVVLAVDLPSGLDGDTGARRGSPMRADVTVTMAALKPGLLLGAGPALSGDVEIADIGIVVRGATRFLVVDDDLASIPARSREAHKWSAAVVVVAGSPGMEGAASLASLGALRAGAGMVRLCSPRTEGAPAVSWPLEIVRQEVDPDALVEAVTGESSRSKAIVVGPGLGRRPELRQAIREILASRNAPVVLDADGLAAVDGPADLATLVAASDHAVILTPHAGELERLLGSPEEACGDDRVAVLQRLAESSGAIVLSKGPTTVVVEPEGTVYFVTAGTPALATAGTGDVLAGIIGALLAVNAHDSELDLVDVATLAITIHSEAASRASQDGPVAALDVAEAVRSVVRDWQPE